MSRVASANPSSSPATTAQRPRRRRWHLLLAAGLAVVVLSAVAVLGLRQMSRRTVFPGARFAVPSDQELARQGLEPLDYRTLDGIALRGFWAEPDRPDAPVVVYFHGNAETADQNFDLAAVLDQAGFGVLLAEYRGYAGLGGSPTEQGLYRDGQAAVEAVVARGIDDDRVVLVGRSLGTGVAVELAHRGLGRGLVLVSPYTSMTDMARPLVGPLAPLLVPDRFDSEARARSVRVPAAVIHGTADDLVPFAMGEAMARSLPRGRLVPVPGAGHIGIPGLADLIAREVAAVAAGR